MSQATLSVRIDSKDKYYFEEFCKSAGLNISVAINMFVKEVIREQRLPFTVKGDPFYSEKNMERLHKSIAAAENGKVTYHDLIEEDD